MKVIFCCCLLVGICANSFAQYHNLVFEGGGTRGIAYAGVIQVLEQKNILSNVTHVAGTSAGSIVALMISVGYSSAEIDSIMFALKVQKFNDGHGGLYGKYRRAKKFFGIHKGNRFAQWIGSLIEHKTGKAELTFAELDSLKNTSTQFKSFYCLGTNLTQQKLEVFSAATTPAMQIKTAVRISCAIPFFYEPVILDSTGREVNQINKNGHCQVYADGGILANYPISLFDTCKAGGQPLLCDALRYNVHTLGFKLDREKQINAYDSTTHIAPFKINSLKSYSAAFYNLVMETLNRKPNLENEIGRTVYIPYYKNFSNPRKMSKADKNILYKSGQQATAAFFTNKNTNAR